MDFLAGRALAEHPPAPAAEGQPHEIHGTGLQFEIIRARAECLGLARRVERAVAASENDTEAVLRRMLNDARQTLRQLEKDTPAVEAAVGDTVPKTVIFEYASSVKALLEALPGRIATLLPEELADTIRASIALEVESVMTQASSVPVEI